MKKINNFIIALLILFATVLCFEFSNKGFDYSQNKLPKSVVNVVTKTYKNNHDSFNIFVKVLADSNNQLFLIEISDCGQKALLYCNEKKILYKRHNRLIVNHDGNVWKEVNSTTANITHEKLSYFR